MALRAGYKGFKKLISPLILNRPGTIGIDRDALNAELNEVFFPRSEEAVLGAKQFYDIDKSALQLSSVTATKTNNGWRVQTSASATFPFASFPLNIPVNTDIRFSCEVAITSGVAVISFDGSNDGSSYTAIKRIFNPGENVNDVFNSDNYKYYRMRLFTNFNDDPSSDGDILYSNILFTLATDTDRTVVPYALTNRELTESAADQKTAINAIITAATSAADFAAFKAAMEAITPVTRSAAPEATREVIEEEPVTVKKTTRKKSTAAAETEKEGE